MILWGQPFWLFALILPVLFIAAELLLRPVFRRKRSRFASDNMFARIAPDHSDALRRSKRILFVLALVFLIIGLANPRVGTRFEEVKREGIDIVLAVDVSRSMDSQDIRPSRLAKTRYELARFIEGMKGDRVGIVPFAGSAYPLLPMTLDYSAARMFLDLLGTDLIPVQGTNLAEAIHVALKVFPEADQRGRAIVLVSDGEDHEGKALETAKEAAKMGIKVYCIGMALEKGDPIPVYGDNNQRTGWLQDEKGDIVRSGLNEDLLRSLADATGGAYRRADQGGSAFKAIYNHLFELDRKEFEAKQITGHEDRFQPFLLIALLLLIVQFMLPDGKIHRRRKMKKSSEIAAFLAFALLAGTASSARADNPHNLVKEGNKNVIEKQLDDALVKYLEAKASRDSLRPELNYNLGGVYSRKGDLEKADSLFRSLPLDTRKDLLARAAYNRGTTFANAQQYDKAIESYIESLKLDPGDADTKQNLELALQQLQQQQQQQQQNQDNQDQDKDQDKKDQQDQQNQDQNQQDKQDQQQDEQEQNQQNQEQQNQQEENQEQQPQPQSQEEMDRELAERLLDQLKENEKDLLKKVVRQQMPQKKKTSGKPW